MAEIMETNEQKGVTIPLKTREVICMSRKISGKGCNGCRFCGIESLCVRPARVQSAISLYDGTAVRKIH